jgi:inosine/xanthosine triphosphate pyrophosphatase family protein
MKYIMGKRSDLYGPKLTLSVSVDGQNNSFVIYGRLSPHSRAARRVFIRPAAGALSGLAANSDNQRRALKCLAGEVFRAGSALALYTVLDPSDPEPAREMLESVGFRWCGTEEASLVFELTRVALAESPVVPHSVLISDANRRALHGWLAEVRPITATLATGSSVKFAQYEFLFRSNGVAIKQSRMSDMVSEPQVEGEGEDSERILVTEPLKRLAMHAKRADSYPLLVEDTMLFIEHFNNDFDRPLLPGPDTKRWWNALGAKGVLSLMDRSCRRRARYVCQIGVHTPSSYKVFRSSREGFIIDSLHPRSTTSEYEPYSNPTAFHSIFVPDGGTVTYAEMSPGEFGAHDYRTTCAAEVASYLWKHESRRPLSQLPLWN